MPHARVNGVDLHYEVYGLGEPLVLVHEFAGCSRSWAPQVESFERAYQVVIYNCRGYPPSTVPADVGSYSQELSVEDLRQLLDHLLIERTILGGFSMGGSIALSFAIRYPARVKALLLTGTGTGSTDKAEFIRDFTPIADRLEREGVRALAEDYLRGPTRIQLLRKSPVMWEKFHADFLTLSALGLANTLRGVQLRRPSVYELEAQLKALRIPTLVMVGDEDMPALEPSRFLARTIPGAELKVLPGTGHTLNLEEPETYNASILDFLQRVRDKK